MKSFLQAVLFLFGTTLTVSAQRVCGSDNYKRQLLIDNPSIKDAFKNVEQQIRTAGTRSNNSVAMRDTAAGEIIYIPVVVHILYNNNADNISDAQVRSQLEVLNKDFRMTNSDRVNTPQPFKIFAGDARIQFCLAQLDPQGKSSTGIERKYTAQEIFAVDDAMKMPLKGGIAAWDSKHYLNIWVCKLGGSSMGYATPPGAAAGLDGVVIACDVFGTAGNLRPIFNKGRTATHEIGHWLGLIHTWGDQDCGNDQVDDTPAQESYNFGCETFPKMSHCSPNSNGDMFMNFMDFSDDACMNLFTKGQVKRMRSLFAENNLRNSFLSSFACDSSLAKGAALPVVTTSTPATTSLSATKIYPGPVHSMATIECKAATTLAIKAVTIFNSLGMKVAVAKLTGERTMLNLSNLTPGIYIVQITGGEEHFTTKIIKQ